MPQQNWGRPSSIQKDRSDNIKRNVQHLIVEQAVTRSRQLKMSDAALLESRQGVAEVRADESEQHVQLHKVSPTLCEQETISYNRRHFCERQMPTMRRG